MKKSVSVLIRMFCFKEKENLNFNIPAPEMLSCSTKVHKQMERAVFK